MTWPKVFRAAAAVAVIALLWVRAASIRNGFAAVASNAVAGIASGLALVWIFRSFASLRNTPGSIARSAAIGLFVFTPLSALLLDWSGDTQSSSVVLLMVAGALAAMGGAIWGVANLAHDAWNDWHSHAPRTRMQPQLKGAGT